MTGTREVTLHQQAGVEDVNSRIRMCAYNVGPGGGPQTYSLTIEDAPGSVRDVGTLNFAALGKPGITNEVQVASVLDRLISFQQGEFSCEENAEAIVHGRAMLAALQRRTARRKDQGTEGTLVEKKAVKEVAATPASRVMVNGSDLVIGGTRLPLSPLQSQWNPWSAVEAVAKKLKPPISAAEIEVLKTVAIERAARNGLNETLSALANQTG